MSRRTLRENYILVTPRFQRKSRVRIETKRIDQLRVQNNFTLFFFFIAGVNWKTRSSKYSSKYWKGKNYDIVQNRQCFCTRNSERDL